MLENRVGVVTQQSFEVLEIDENFFDESGM